MKNILFRGKSINDGLWVFGFYFCEKSETTELHFIKNKETVQVDSNTVGQYTGKNDRNGNKIFEKDIVRHKNGIKLVQYDTESLSYQMEISDFVLDQEVGINYEKEIEIIGNICDTPNLTNSEQNQ